MEEIEFIQLKPEVKDGGQRIEVDVVAAAPSVAAAVSEFYRLMAQVKGIDADSEGGIREKLDEIAGPEVAAEALRDFVLNRLTTAAVRQVDADTVLTPGVHAEGNPIPGEDFAFTVNLIPRPEVSLSSTEPVHVKAGRVQVEQQDIDGQLAYTAEQFVQLAPAGHDDLREGDFAIADMDMLCDGKPVKDLSGLGRVVEVRRGLVPDAFLDGVIGMVPGEMRQFSFALEDSDGIREYKADVHLHDLKRREVPVIDDAWVAENLPQFGSRAGFCDYIRADLEQQAARVEQQDLVYQVRSALAERLQGSIPDEMYQDAKDSLTASTMRKLDAEGTTLDKYLQEHDMTPDAFNMNVFMQASELLRQNLALEALARARGMEATAEDIAQAKTSLPSAARGLTDGELEARGLLGPLTECILREKALAWLLDTAVVE